MFCRLRHLYAIGYDTAAIASILEDEFQDIEVNPIKVSDIEELIQKNQEMLLGYKAEMALLCKEDCIQQMKETFKTVYNTEHRMTSSLVQKMEQMIGAMIALDMGQLDDSGRPVNMGVYFTLLEAFERTQKLIAKIGGTDSFRDVEVHRARKRIDDESKGSSLLPAAREGENGSTPTFTG
jgi:hypothetical protein